MNVRLGPVLCLVALAALAWGCAPPESAEEPVELETEDIGPAADSELDLSGDEVAQRRNRGLGGQLPSSWPAGLPVYQPSTIVDIGEGGKGGYVLFETSAARGAVESWLRSALGGGGWAVAAQSGDVLVASRGPLRAQISISDAGPVTAIRVEY